MSIVLVRIVIRSATREMYILWTNVCYATTFRGYSLRCHNAGFVSFNTTSTPHTTTPLHHYTTTTTGTTTSTSYSIQELWLLQLRLQNPRRNNLKRPPRRNAFPNVPRRNIPQQNKPQRNAPRRNKARLKDLLLKYFAQQDAIRSFKVEIPGWVFYGI